jgi:hypothetical protein
MLNAFLALRALPWKAIGLGALALAFLSLIAALKMERAHSAKLQSQVIACSEARKADRSAYEAAQAKAAADNLSHVRKVESEQQRISDARESNYRAELARLHAIGVRQQTPSAPQGHPGSPGTPQVPAAPGGPDGAAQVCVPASDALSSAETELKLLHLQAWIADQLKINR